MLDRVALSLILTAKLKIPSAHRTWYFRKFHSRKWLELGSRKCLVEYFTMEQRWYVMDFRARSRFRHSIILRSNKHWWTTTHAYGNENGPLLPEWNLSQPLAGCFADACNPGRCCRVTSSRAVRQRPTPCCRSLKGRKINEAICRWNYWWIILRTVRGERNLLHYCIHSSTRSTESQCHRKISAIKTE